MKLIMTGLDHTRADLATREKFALTKENARRLLTAIRNDGAACVVLSTCNRTELYASVPDRMGFLPSKALCDSLGRNCGEFERYFTERNGDAALEHLCRVASGLDSQIIGDEQIITQVREALELSRGQLCADAYLETAFKLSVQSSKVIRNSVCLRPQDAASAPGKAVEKLKTLCELPGRRAVVIGNGQMGRLAAELLLREKVRVTVTLRQYKNGAVKVPEGAEAVNYGERYSAIQEADIVLSATTSPHFTLRRGELAAISRVPEIIVDLAVPRDVEPSVRDLSGVTLLTIDDISGESRALPPESLLEADKIISRHIEKYHKWLAFKESIEPAASGGKYENIRGWVRAG